MKEIFKPSISKIILCILIFSLFVPFIEYDTGVRCIRFPCPYASASGSIFIWLIKSNNFSIYSISYFIILPGLILSYLISCLIIFLTKKLKK